MTHFVLRPFVTTLLFVSLSSLSGCSLVLDFEDEVGLPCPCDEAHVCLVPSKKCVPRKSVERFKSCDLGADRPDDLCAADTICESVNGLGRRCLPRCTVSSYATPESALKIASDCPTGYTCWPSDRGGGVCSEGICDPLRADCPYPQSCVAFNGAGVCFTPCEIFRATPPPCAGNQVCHTIGNSPFTACVEQGTRTRGELCSDTALCAARDEVNRSMVCASAANSSELDHRCRAICRCPAGQGACDNSACASNAVCAIVRAGVDPASAVGLGVCIEQ